MPPRSGLPPRPGRSPVPVRATLSAAFQHLDAGRLKEAKALARDLARRAPEERGVAYLSGLVALAEGDARAALPHLRKAARSEPDAVPVHSALARAALAAGRPEEAVAAAEAAAARAPESPDPHALHAEALRGAGRADAAEAAYRRALERAPGRADLRNDLGTLLRTLGRASEAEREYRAAIAARPNYARAHANLGLFLAEEGRSEEARAEIQAALAADPKHAGAWNTMGLILLDRQPAEALAHFAKALELRPGFSDAALNAGLALRRLGRPQDAWNAFAEAARLAPKSARVHFCLGETTEALGRPNDAAGHYRKALDLDPDDTCGARLKLSLLGRLPVPDAPPPAYVRQLFDDFADRFDRTLKEKLDYRAPDILLAAVTAVAPDRRFDVLDLGCGTGLAGLAFRERASRLVGVDLSPRMIDKARGRGIYDALIVGDVRSALGGGETHDLIVAADVFVYLGDLGSVAKDAARALRPGGLLAFTVERSDAVPAGFELHAHQRYAHGREHVSRAVAEAGLRLLACEDTSARTEGGRPVPGLCVVAAKPAEA